MKKLIIITLALICANVNLNASRIVSVTKSGGIFGGYWNVTQEFDGFDQHGNSYWSLTCKDPGFTRCKLTPAGVITSEDPADDEIATAEVNSCGQAIDWVDNEIETNSVTSGTATKHYQVTLSNNTTIDIYVELSWAPISGTSDYSITATIL